MDLSFKDLKEIKKSKNIIDCDYCENDKTIMKEQCVNMSPFYMYGSDNINTTVAEVEEIGGYELGLFIDRGYLRLVDLEDSGCLDHGEKIKINYCPFCGKELNKGWQ